MAGVISWFWKDSFWLPPNVTWADLKDTEKAVYPRLEDFSALLPLAITLLFIRTAFERCIATPLGLGLGIKHSNSYTAEPNIILDKVFKSVTSKPDQKRLEGLAKQLDWSVRSVERWFRRKRNQSKPTVLVKFSETCWRSVFYIVAFSYGIYTIPREAWFWDLRKCWHNFPFHSVTSSIYNYYMLEMSFYLSLVLSLFTDVRRKDFVPQFIHHFTTIFLMGFSWTCNFTRIGCIVLVTHDVADIFLEVGKMCNYGTFHAAADALFGIFTIVYFVSRILFLPFWVIYSALVHSMDIMGPFPAYYLFNGLLVVLQILNAYWFCLIMKMVYKTFVHGQVTKDERSDVEESLSDSEMAQENGDSCNHSSLNHNSVNHVNSNIYSKATTNHH